MIDNDNDVIRGFNYALGEIFSFGQEENLGNIYGRSKNETHIFVTDHSNTSIVIYDNNRNYVATLDDEGSIEYDFFYPDKVVTTENSLFVIDENTGVWEFDHQLNFVKQIGNATTVQSAISGTYYDNKLYVLLFDIGISIFDVTTGSYLETIDLTNVAPFDSFSDISYNENYFYVLGFSTNYVHIFDLNMNFISALYSFPVTAPGWPMTSPVAIDTYDHTIAISSYSPGILFLDDGVPRELSVAAGNENIALSWKYPDNTQNSEFSHFNIYRSEGDADNFNFYAQSSVPYFIDESVKSGEQYFYKVTASDGFGETPSTNIANDIAPTRNLTIEVPGNVTTDFSTLTEGSGFLSIAPIFSIFSIITIVFLLRKKKL